MKRTRRSFKGFPNLVYEYGRSVAQESRPFANVHDSLRFKSHQTRAGCVRSDRVIREHNLSQKTRSTVQWAVAFHGYDAVRDDKVNRNGGAQIEDALLDALPMKNIFRPSVSCTRHKSEHVLHAERDARPVVSLDFGHGNQEVGLQHSAREPEASHPHVVRAQRCANELVAIEIDETDLLITE